jgi:hypothetical protein
MELTKEVRASEIIQKFRSLVNQAENIAFPKTTNSIFRPINTESWLPIRKFLYKASMPFLYIVKSDSIRSGIYFALSFMMLIMVYWTLALAQEIAKGIPFEANSIQFGAFAIFLFLSIYGFINFVNDARYNSGLRILVMGIFLLVCLIYTVSLFPTIPPNTHVITSWGKYFKVLFLISTAFSPIMIFLINTVLNALLAFAQFLNFTETIQTPTTDKSIEKLLQATISSDTNSNQKIRILDLSKGEVTSLRLWAESRLASSEKRTIPALVVAALIGPLWSVEWVRNLITSTVTMVTKNNYQAIIGWIVITMLLLFIAAFSKTMVEIFKNIAIQSLIVETCHVAEYAIKEEKIISVQKENLSISNILSVVAEVIKKAIHK